MLRIEIPLVPPTVNHYKKPALFRRKRGGPPVRAALAQWDPMTQEEPEGWFRNPQTGRRRPNGDAAMEHVRK